MSRSQYELVSFKHKVRDALQAVERVLEVERKPHLAEEVEHTYGDKYGLVNTTTNAAIIAYINALKVLGLDAGVLKSIDKTKATTIRFDSSIDCKFKEEVVVDVPMDVSFTKEEEIKSTGIFGNSKKSTVSKVVHHVKEFHYNVEINWSISLYSGTKSDMKKVIKSRKCVTNLITQSERAPLPEHKNYAPFELSLTWLLKQIDTENLTSNFKVDMEHEKTKTPRRNDETQKAIDFAENMDIWFGNIKVFFVNTLKNAVIVHHNPALPKPQTFSVSQLMTIQNDYKIFNPILPLMEEVNEAGGEEDQVTNMSVLGLMAVPGDDSMTNSAVFTSKDMAKLLNEQVRTLDESMVGISKSLPFEASSNILSCAEASLVLVGHHICDLISNFCASMCYVEDMMDRQLVAAIGKRVSSEDLDKFVEFHNAKFLSPVPKPFSHAIRRPEHYPVGLLSIEGQAGENKCIFTHTREVKPSSSLNIPLTAATVLELTGEQYLHGWMQHRFGTSHKNHHLIARARQFSSFILVIGTMTGPNTLEPKDAIIVQNKDEVLIPLLLEELPTAKEFKDAVKSLSPEQQEFAKAFRSMQLASSVFGICIIQIKPQLESLLGLPRDSLDKEMKLTQDLMELFIDYQVPSDLLSYNGVMEDVAVEDKISNVKEHVKAVLDVVEGEKDKQLKAAERKTDMAAETRIQRVLDDDASQATALYACSLAEASDNLSQQANIFQKSAKSQERFRSAGAGSRPEARRRMIAGAAPTAMAMMPQRSAGGPTRMMSKKAAAAIPSVAPLCAMSTSSDAFSPSDVSSFDSSATRKESASSTAVEGGKPSLSDSPHKQPSSCQSFDLTSIPQTIDGAVENYAKECALRSTIIKTTEEWTRNRQENLLSKPKKETLKSNDLKFLKNKAFDLLDALSRSGSLPIHFSELHVVVAVTHYFEKDVMATVIQDNVNPIEKLEMSTLLLASAIHGVPARELVRTGNDLNRLEIALPRLLKNERNE